MELPRPPAPVRQPSANKASAILLGAMDEFLQQGCTATSMDRIARTAGVSKATVYSHFTNKESLFDALTRAMVHDHFAELFGDEVIEVIPADPAWPSDGWPHGCSTSTAAIPASFPF